jgi:hypothetical protein
MCRRDDDNTCNGFGGLPQNGGLSRFDPRAPPSGGASLLQQNLARKLTIAAWRTNYRTMVTLKLHMKHRFI